MINTHFLFLSLCQCFKVISGSYPMNANVCSKASKGLRSVSVSNCTKVDARRKLANTT